MRFPVCRINVLLFSSLLLLFAASTHAALPPETRWADPSSVSLEVEFPGNGYHATWDMFRCSCGDLLIRSELSVPGAVESGESLLVSGRVVLSRGFGDADESLLGASLDAPALMMQLVLTLLERVAPAGPSGIFNGDEVSVDEAAIQIYLDSGGAEGTFWAPWSVTATIKPLNETARQFDLRFQFSTGNPGEELIGSMRLWGTAEYARLPFPIESTAALSDWVMTWRNETDPAIGATENLSTLGELRELLKTNQ
jgi:hypothetical protein